MATPSYKAVRRMIESLTREEQLRLVREVAGHDPAVERHSEGPASIMELCGLGQEIWDGIDAQQYVSRERFSWNG